MMQSNKRQAGFTLVEIAIVLVIIGLLLGGILKGQEMITQAKIKNLVADLNGITAAMNSYQDRYKALPGDDKGAKDRWATTSSGDGNGVVGGTYNATVPATLTGQTGPESVFFWHHLRLAGFLSGTGADQPFNAVSGKMGVQTGNGAATPVEVLASTVAGFTSLIVCSANLPDKIAGSTDAQMDDGIGTTGSVRGMVQPKPDPDIAAKADAYVETGTSQYVICKQL
jgi:prepilin-type N-terminal cleavage/methylation domain-containing protein